MVSHLSSFNYGFQYIYYKMVIPGPSEESYCSDKLRPSGISFPGFLKSHDAGHICLDTSAQEHFQTG